MHRKKTCACGGAPQLIFPCSGGSDVGALTDLAARKLTKDGAGRMYCLAGIGGRVSGIMASTAGASRILAIDGCPLDCARKTLELAGFKRLRQVRLSAIGLQKGQAPATAKNIAKVAAAGAAKLAR